MEKMFGARKGITQMSEPIFQEKIVFANLI